MASEREAQRAFPNLYPTSSANRARGQPTPHSPSPSPSPTGLIYPLPRGAPWEKVKDLISNGTTCPDAADKIVADYDVYTKQSNSNAGRGGSNRGRGRGRGRQCNNPSANTVSTTSTTQSSQATLPQEHPPPSDSQVHRATSIEPPSPHPPPPNANAYGILDREMESDSADHAAYDDADFALADNTNTDYPYVVSACHANVSPPVTTRYVSTALNTLATKHLCSHATSIAHPIPNATQAVADSGATDNMFPDYSAFISYHHQHNRFVTLGDHTKLPILGVGSAKIKLNGKVVILHDTVDNLVSYEPLGNSVPTIKIDYCQPRHYTPPAARPAAHLSIQYSIPLPKCVRVAAPPHPTSIPSPSSTPDPATISAETLHIPDKDLIRTSVTPLPPRLLKSIHSDPATLPPIPPYATPSAIESWTQFDSLKLHGIFGCRRFRNQENITSASLNATLVKTGGYKYALLLVDVATRYSWLYGLQTLTGHDITAALDAFISETGSVPRTFHADFDKKLIGGSALRWIHSHNSRIKAAPASRQSSNGLVEATWKTIVKMALAYLTEKQMTREFWFYAVKHATRMMNHIPGRMGRRLVCPFELVHGTKPDSTNWFELFSVGFFKTDSSSDGKHSKTQSMSLAGIAVGRDDTSNTILFYNPVTWSYYRPQAFTLDESRLPLAQWPGLIMPDGSLACGLLRNNTDPTPEPFPPGTRVTLVRNDTQIKGTISNVPTPPTSTLIRTAAHPTVPSPTSISSPDSSLYTVLLDNGTTTESLHPTNPDRDAWLRSYNEEKGGLESMDVFERINKKQYLILKCSGRIGKALPSMCVLVVKTDKDGKPNRAKSCIVVLGNFEDRIYERSQKYAPVLKYTSLRLLTSKAVSDQRILQQGDCKNAFCQAYLPDDELTVVRPPLGDPAYSRVLATQKDPLRTLT
eukprot:CCRYP_008549-RA/>CCRYP_008549-RA protein AED:0.36 eAED:0.17 QI:0/0/0/0.8/1/1/5/0/922